MSSRTITHDLGGTHVGTLACMEAIRKAIHAKGFCSESEARGMAMSLYPPQVLVRIGAQKLKNRPRGSSCRFAAEVETYMAGGAVSPDAVECFRIVGGKRQLTRLKQYAKSGFCDDVSYDENEKRFVSSFAHCVSDTPRQMSAEARASLTPETMNGQQRRVFEYIRDQGELGATDEECQRGLAMNPSSQRPRRGELADAGLIVVAGKRMTSANKRATVWRAAT